MLQCLNAGHEKIGPAEEGNDPVPAADHGTGDHHQQAVEDISNQDTVVDVEKALTRSKGSMYPFHHKVYKGLIDATYGRRSRSVLVTDSDHVILSPIQPETIANRLSSEYEAAEEEENDE